MNKTIQAWKNPAFRATLTETDLENPVGMIELTAPRSIRCRVVARSAAAGRQRQGQRQRRSKKSKKSKKSGEERRQRQGQRQAASRRRNS